MEMADQHVRELAGSGQGAPTDYCICTQYCDSGDNTLASIKKSVEEVATDEADDYSVCALSDANLSRYGIGAASLGQALRTNAKVKTAIIFLDKG
ncbi:hypothetical protein CF326_g7861 [Tilletia indica]|nr:hypothetical protein CF326_g7861 [Tilletia indica]